MSTISVTRHETSAGAPERALGPYARRPSPKPLPVSRRGRDRGRGRRRLIFHHREGPMSQDIPFDKSFDLPPGRIEEVTPGVRRLLVNNPGPFTFKGTLTYIVGTGSVAVIDPGPVDEAHLATLL